jgi:hypothetical protein
MTREKPFDNDPTAEQETPEFDGTQTMQLDDTYRFRVVAASESAIGSVDHDDRGQARWKFKADTAPSDPTAETFDYLKALDANLEIERSQTIPALAPPKAPGSDPYDSSPPAKDKKRRD